MAFVKNFQHDVFISYAYADDTPDASGKGWVSQFVAQLECALKQRLGGTNALRIFFDSRDLNSNHQLNVLLKPPGVLPSSSRLRRGVTQVMTGRSVN